MSEENKETAKPAAPAAKTPEPPPPPEPGEYGKRLEKMGIPVQHLGKDAMGIEMIAVNGADVIRASSFLRDDCQFNLLVSCAGVDWKTHLQSVYHLYSLETHDKLAMKVDAVQKGDDWHSPSLTPIWPAADWHERESYDLYGIHYDNHPNLTRILMPIDWVGHPLRKDYKVTDPRLVWNER